MTFRDHLIGLGGDAEKAVLDVYRSYLAGSISHDVAVDLMAVVVEKFNLRAAALADVSLAATLMVETAAPVPVVASAPVVGGDRLVKAATTVLTVAESSDVPEAIVARLARSEVFNAGQVAYTEGIRSSGLTKGWVRGLEPDACQLCRWWWREGRVWPADHPMPRHQGCTCSPIPVVRDNIKSTGHTRNMARRAASEGAAA